METERIKSILESLIFVSEEPITIQKLAQLIEGSEKKDLRAILDELKQEYIDRGCGIELVEVAGGYQFRTTADNSKWVAKLFEERPHRLTRASLETIAIIAYRQPLVRMEIERIRGVDAGGVIKTLLERNLIRIVGRQEVPGRPVLYGTTPQFMEFFGLKSLADLPPLRDITELGDAAEEFIAEFADRAGLPEAGIPLDPQGAETQTEAPDQAAPSPDAENVGAETKATSEEPEQTSEHNDKEPYVEDDCCHEADDSEDIDREEPDPDDLIPNPFPDEESAPDDDGDTIDEESGSDDEEE